MTIKGFGAGVTREQIEARLGPGSRLDDEQGWMWSPPMPKVKPGETLPLITFEMLVLKKWKQRWYLEGSQFEYGGQKFVTRIYCADSIWQGTVQGHFGPGTFSGQGNDISLDYRDVAGSDLELSFHINNIDEFWPNSTRAVTGTTISWPAADPAAPAGPRAPTSSAHRHLSLSARSREKVVIRPDPAGR